ncbi:LacI family DNA-binding transcriptional regulator [Kineococcus indalonis]|uniref:LacI family DNA-binding transcriptional regulator n=1 Tax=Kineococcus indalonis TaxID=2696566 RepID=UPI0014137666|nr:substrate-binding domain-containing protein [Kineococcus indalonis]
MADVAVRAGVSISTVSRALGGAAGVSEATRERVRAVADELAYVVSPEASRLSRGSTGRVGVLVPAIHLWYYASVVAGLEAVLRESELDLLLYHVEGPEDRRRFFDRLPARRKVDALVVVALPTTAEQHRRLDDLGVAIISAGASSEQHPWVAVDDAAAAGAAVEHLLALGHERIAMIRTVEPDGGDWQADRQRLAGYRSALQRAGLEEDRDLVVTVPWGPDGGARAMDRLLTLPHPPTGVFAYSDEVAIGALRSLRRARVEVPGAVSLVGVDDHPMADLTDLTTVAQEPVVIGRCAAALALRTLGLPVPVDLQHVRTDGQRLGTRLVVRGTTAPPRAAGARLAPPRSPAAAEVLRAPRS